MCDFISEILVLGWKPNHIHEYHCAGMEHRNPRLIRDVKAHKFWKMFQKKRDKEDAEEYTRLAAMPHSDLTEPPKKRWRPGRGTFLLLLEHLTVELKNKSCLSYFYLRMVQCFQDHGKFIDHLMDVYKAGSAEWEDTFGNNTDTCPRKPCLPDFNELILKKREVEEVFAYAKHHMAGHLTVGKHDPCRFHCVSHALGDCKQNHEEDCAECGKLHRFGENMSRFHQDWANRLCRAYENDLPSFQKSARTARATEPQLVDYVGRSLRKDFGGGEIHYGLVVAKDVCDDTSKVMYRVLFGDGDEEDYYVPDLLPLLLELGPDARCAPEDWDEDNPAGLNRTRLMDLIRLARHNAHVPQNWCSHQGRGKHNQYHIDLEEPEMMKEGNEDIVRLDIDMKSKTLPSKRNTGQGEGMGQRGMSVQGGQYEHVAVSGDGKKYCSREQIHAVYDHGSKQLHDDAMRGLEAQLQAMAVNLKTDRRVRMRSDKCNNFCTFAMIPFILEGNARGWRRPGDEDKGQPKLTVISWIFSEAQCGKDQLDVSFSFVSMSFKNFVASGKNMLTGRDMYVALQLYPVAGTSEVLVDVRAKEDLPVYDLCPLGIQKVHYFEFKPTEVIVRHHPGIDTIGVWRTSNESVFKWSKGGSKNRAAKKDQRPFVSKPPIVIDTFVNMKPVQKRLKLGMIGKKRKRVSHSFECAAMHTGANAKAAWASPFCFPIAARGSDGVSIDAKSSV